MIVYILEDHPMVSHGIKILLESDSKDYSFATCDSLNEAMDTLDNLEYDLAIVDLNLKGQRTFQWLEKAVQLYPHRKHLVFTSSVRRDYFEKAFHLGANGYLVKESQPEDLIYAVKTVMQDRVFKDPIFSEIPSHSKPKTDILTEREKQVLRLLANGKTNQEIADTLFVSIYTIKKYVTSTLAKMEFANRTEAAIYAQTHYI